MQAKSRKAQKVTLETGYSSPRWSHEITDCSMPMTFDQYGRCSYDCFYCFANYQKSVGCAKQNFYSDTLKHVNVQRVKDIFSLKKESQFSPLIEQRKVLQWGGMADPFCPYEKEHGIGLELLRFFKEIDYPICFSTKGTWWTKDRKYAELFEGQKNWNVKFSIITLDRKLARVVEVGVPSPEGRLEALKRVVDFDCGGATLRLRPFIIGVSNPTHVDLIRKAGALGATALSTEFFCLETRSPALRADLRKISMMVGFDILKFYKRYSYMAGYLRLNRNAKRKFVDEMEAAARDAGMRFYVSDAHFKERCDNGSCCGLPEDWNYCRGQWCEALQIAKRDGKVKWSDVSTHLAYAKGFLWRRAEGYNTGSSEKRAQFWGMSMYDWLRHVWNHPNHGESPYKMYEGILKPSGKKTKSGDLVYVYDAEQE